MTNNKNAKKMITGYNNKIKTLWYGPEIEVEKVWRRLKPEVKKSLTPPKSGHNDTEYFYLTFKHIVNTFTL